MGLLVNAVKVSYEMHQDLWDLCTSVSGIQVTKVTCRTTDQAVCQLRECGFSSPTPIGSVLVALVGNLCWSIVKHGYYIYIERERVPILLQVQLCECVYVSANLTAFVDATGWHCCYCAAVAIAIAIAVGVGTVVLVLRCIHFSLCSCVLSPGKCAKVQLSLEIVQFWPLRTEEGAHTKSGHHWTRIVFVLKSIAVGLGYTL